MHPQLCSVSTLRNGSAMRGASIASAVTALTAALLSCAGTAMGAWSTNPGVNNVVCEATNNQDNAQSCSDGSGGVIVSYRDFRSGSRFDVYAQRLDANGDAVWTSGGVSLSPSTANKNGPVITSDGAGGAIVVWQDARNGNNDLFAQRIDASGNLVWASDVPVTAAAGTQSGPSITGDGSGGAVIVWQDNRAGNLDLYAQRVDSSGNVQWGADGLGIVTLTSGQAFPSISAGGSGTYYVSWADGRNGGGTDIYVQKLDSSGNELWTADGVLLCSAVDAQAGNRNIPDGSGGAIVVWEDRRNGSGNFDIYARKVDNTGTPQWTADGIALGTGPLDDTFPALATDGSGGAIFAWTSKIAADGTDYDVIAQRVDSAGAKQWGASGINLKSDTVETTGAQVLPSVKPDGSGGAYFVWEDSRSNVSTDVYAQRISSNGTVQWTTGGVVVSNAPASKFMNSTVLTTDGIIAVWNDGRSGSTSDIYAQHVTASGFVPVAISRFGLE